MSDRNEASIELAAPPEQVFPLIAEPAGRLRWIDGLVEAETTGPGEFREAIEQHGLRVETRVRTIRSEPPHVVEAVVSGRGIEATVRNQLEPAPAGTRLTVTVETRYRGLAARLVAPVVGRRAQASLERSLANLKALLDHLEAAGAQDAPEEPEPEQP